MNNSFKKPTFYFLFIWLVLGSALNLLLRDQFGESRQLATFICVVVIFIGFMINALLDFSITGSLLFKLLQCIVCVGALSISMNYLLIKIPMVSGMANGVDLDHMMWHTFLLALAMVGPLMYLARRRSQPPSATKAS